MERLQVLLAPFAIKRNVVVAQSFDGAESSRDVLAKYTTSKLWLETSARKVLSPLRYFSLGSIDVVKHKGKHSDP